MRFELIIASDTVTYRIGHLCSLVCIVPLKMHPHDKLTGFDIVQDFSTLDYSSAIQILMRGTVQNTIYKGPVFQIR